MLRYFDVALWRRWPSLMPEVCAAVEVLMQRARLSFVAYASARTLDGSPIYRGYEVEVLFSAHLGQAPGGKEVRADGWCAWHALLSGATQFTCFSFLSCSLWSIGWIGKEVGV